jgi:lipopolysaccharide heptosyltransferase II
MDVDFMRIVDKWVGVPLCFLFSLYDHFLRIFIKPEKKKPIRKILFIQISEMGSTISAYSALRKTQKLFPDSELYYFIFKEMQESIKLLGVIPESNVLTVPSKSLKGMLVESWKLILRVRKLQIDAVVDFELFSRISVLFSYLFGCPVRVGFNKFHMEGLYRGSFQTHKVIYNHMKHISQNFLSLVYSLQQTANEVPFSKIKIQEDDISIPKLRSSKEDQQQLLIKLQEHNPGISEEKLIVIFNPNGSNMVPLRRWPITNYIELAKKLLVNQSVYIVCTGTSVEKKDATAICNAVGNSRCINFAGQTTLRELIDLFSVSQLLVSNDSGPPNFAVLTDIKVIVFFGPETPQCYIPLGHAVESLYSNFMCSPCVSAYNHRKSPCRDNKCLQAITVDMVCNRINTLIPGLIVTQLKT